MALSKKIRKGVYSVEQFRRDIKSQLDAATSTFQARMSMVYGLLEAHRDREIVFYFEKLKNENR